MSSRTTLMIAVALLVGCPEEMVEKETPPTTANQAPVLLMPDDATVEVGDVFEVLLEASDPDGDELTFAIDQGPDTAAITGRLLQWAPEVDDVGSNVFQVSVTDDGEPPLSAVVSFGVTVAEPTAPNEAPVADAVADQSVVEEETLEVTFTAVDPDEDGLTWSSDSLPDGASLTPAGVLTYTPERGDAGAYPVTVTVTDDGEPPLSDDVAFTIDVEAAAESYDIEGLALNALTFATIGDVCVELVDPTPVISGGVAIVLDSTTTGPNGDYRFDDVTAKPTLGLLMRLVDCNSTGQLGLPSSTLIEPDLYATLPDGALLAFGPVGMSVADVNGFASAASVAGYPGDLTQGGFLWGSTQDGTNFSPAGGVTVSCVNCMGSYYVDTDPSDGLFTTMGVVNSETVAGVGIVVIPDAPIEQYTATSSTLTFPPLLIGGFPGEAVFAGFVGM
ncbi:MAG: putative Ig domain-containing protein [Myxococcota bacterium]